MPWLLPKPWENGFDPVTVRKLGAQYQLCRRWHKGVQAMQLPVLHTLMGDADYSAVLPALGNTFLSIDGTNPAIMGGAVHSLVPAQHQNMPELFFRVDGPGFLVPNGLDHPVYITNGPNTSTTLFRSPHVLTPGPNTLIFRVTAASERANGGLGGARVGSNGMTIAFDSRGRLTALFGTSTTVGRNILSDLLGKTFTCAISTDDVTWRVFCHDQLLGEWPVPTGNSVALDRWTYMGCVGGDNEPWARFTGIMHAHILARRFIDLQEYRQIHAELESLYPGT